MDTSQIIDPVLELVQKVGLFIEDFKEKGFKTETKFFNNLVTEVDIAAEQKLVEGLGAIFPEAGFIAEEGSGEKAAGWNWIIDPIDGTTNFSHGIPVYSISIALWSEAKGVVLAVVHDIPNAKSYWAHEKKEGAFKGNQAIQVSKTPSLDQGLLATGFPYDNFEIQELYVALFADLLGSCRGIRRLGSAALDLVYVAEGKFDLFFEYGLNPWDVAGGSYILQKAGGQLSCFSGKEYSVFGKETIASNGLFHKEFIRKIESIKGD